MYAMDALWHCDRPEGEVDIVVVINASESAPTPIIRQNEKSVADLQQWISGHRDDTFRLHLIIDNAMPEKHAGVGLARKLGMDFAAQQLVDRGREDGILLCFDADCTCDRNYLVAVHQHFLSHPKSTGCSIYFEHPMEFDDHQTALMEGIVQYELHLRYMKLALRDTGFPYAFHTVGSSMAVRAWAYLRQGGMNRRKAGEDFYFLQKVFQLGGFTELAATRVIPSPRISDRVPFGTGRAMGVWTKEKSTEYLTYHPNAYHALNWLFSRINQGNWLNDLASVSVLNTAPLPMREFLGEQGLASKIAEIRTHTSTDQSAVRRFYAWFNNFMVVRYLNDTHQKHYQKIPVIEACERYFGGEPGSGNPSLAWLTRLRNIERQD